MEILHSVTWMLKMQGCKTCIKHCPTEAIRVRRGKARFCPSAVSTAANASGFAASCQKVVCDPFDMLKDFEYKIALPAPSFYGQFKNINDVNIILGGL